MKKFLIPSIILIVILIILGIYFSIQFKPLAAMANAHIPENIPVMNYNGALFDELIKELPQDYLDSDVDQDGIPNSNEIEMGLSPFSEDSDSVEID